MRCGPRSRPGSRPMRSTTCSARRTARRIASPGAGWPPRASGGGRSSRPAPTRRCRTIRHQPLPESLRQAAVAVECFHKASLVHDDIEDADERRYGRETLHVEHGVPVALNAGDLLLGEGYRLLAGCGAPADVCAELVRIAAAGHRELCLGQGAELAWMRRPAAAHRRSGAGHLPPQDVAGVPGRARHRRRAGGRDGGDAAGAARLQRGARHRVSDSRRSRGPGRHGRRRAVRPRRAVAAAGAGVRQGEGRRAATA